MSLRIIFAVEWFSTAWKENIPSVLSVSRPEVCSKFYSPRTHIGNYYVEEKWELKLNFCWRKSKNSVSMSNSSGHQKYEHIHLSYVLVCVCVCARARALLIVTGGIRLFTIRTYMPWCHLHVFRTLRTLHMTSSFTLSHIVCPPNPLHFSQDYGTVCSTRSWFLFPFLQTHCNGLLPALT
jgi:hypothetical protein